MAGLWAKLISEDQVGRVTLAFEQAIADSIGTDRGRTSAILVVSPTITDREVKRRFAICAKIFEALRGDLKWSIARVLDHLPRYLRAELDGVSWMPDTRGAWSTKPNGETP
jgi:hypothetical protein